MWGSALERLGDGPVELTGDLACRSRWGRKRRARLSRRAKHPQQGSAAIEFVAVGLLLMLPVAYLVLVLGRIQAASFAANGAARESGRAFVTAPSEAEGERRALTAFGLALRDHGFEEDAGALEISCSASPCHSPGERATTEIQIAVRFPWLPVGLSDALHTRVTVRSSHVATMDEFREPGT